MKTNQLNPRTPSLISALFKSEQRLREKRDQLSEDLRAKNCPLRFKYFSIFKINLFLYKCIFFKNLLKIRVFRNKNEYFQI